MSEQDGLIWACLLNGAGGADFVDWESIQTWTPEDGVLWVHIDRTGSEANDWLATASEIHPIALETLTAADTRPRVLRMGDDLLVTLRGVNLNPGSNPEDMVGLRVLLQPRRIITVRQRRVMAAQDVRQAFETSNGPKDTGDFLVQLCDRLTDRVGPVIEDLDDQVDALEDQVLQSHSAELRTHLARVRQVAILLRRYLAPQRDAMARLHAETVEWLDDLQRAFLREISDRTLRYVEDLDAARERAAVTQDELANRVAEQMNKTMYVLTVVAGVLLPPSLLTGLLGINVGGMPGVDNVWAFAIVAVLIVVIAAVEIVLFRRLKWI